MSYFETRYDPWLVVLSIVIASFASFVALDLARRVREAGRHAATAWWVGGSVAMGTGIWSMHFIGMLAFSLPIAIGYTALLTVASWVAAVVVSGIALGIASYGRLTFKRLGFGAMTMGAGICTMHYTGMAALDMAPGIVWDVGLVLASVAIAIGASAAALVVFFKLARPQVFGEPSSRQALASPWAWPSAACTTPAWPPRVSHSAPFARAQMR